MDECSRFLAMTPNERWKVVKEQRACFSCLKRSKGHTVTNCSCRKECTERKHDGTTCKRRQHKLLHMDQPNSLNPAQISFLQDNSKAQFPVVAGFIKGSNSVAVEASVFYDSGAQARMVRSSFPESLALQGKPIKIFITKVGGTEERLVTKLYKVLACTNDGNIVQPIQDLGIPQISDEVSDVNVNIWHSFGL